MEIKLMGFEVLEAITNYIEIEYKMKIDVDKLQDNPYLEYRVPNYAYKRHKNGKDKKDKDGYMVIDYDKTTWETKYAPLGDDSAVSIDIY